MHRTMKYRLRPGSKARAEKIARIAGACRSVWNHFLGQNKERYAAYREGKGPKPSVTFFSMGKEFTQLRNSEDHAWLRDHPYEVVRYSLKRLADAWRRGFKHGGLPRFKAKRRSVESFTIPNPQFRGGRLRIPSLGWFDLCRKGGDPHAHGKVKQVVVRREAGRWYAYLIRELPDEAPGVGNGVVIGIDRNAGLVATHDGTAGILHRGPDLARKEARRRRFARMMQRRQGARKGKDGNWIGPSRRYLKARRGHQKACKQIADTQRDWAHKMTKQIAASGQCAVIEDLDVRAMTRSAKGTADKPGVGVKRKAKRNAAILGTQWGLIALMLCYKARELVRVNPAYTSQTCSSCGHVAALNRKGREFKCAVCGYESHADLNAARNIRALGIRASGREGAFASADPPCGGPASDPDDPSTGMPPSLADNGM